MILDEPTNQIDIDSRAELIEAINDFVRCHHLGSHDSIDSMSAPTARVVRMAG